MKKNTFKIPSILLCSLGTVTVLTCGALVTTHVLQNNHVNEHISIPKELLKYDNDTLYGLKDSVTIEQLYLGGFNSLDLRNEYLGETIKKIAPFAFANVFFGTACPIHDITLPQNLVEIGQGAFYNCPSLDNHLSIPKSVQTIGQDAFYYNKYKNIVINDGVKKIGIQAFWHIDTLQSLTIPPSVEEVGFRAFKGLINIDKLDLSGYDSIPTWLYESGTKLQDIGGPGSRHVDVKVKTKVNSIDDWKTILKKHGVGEGITITSTDEKPTDDSCFVMSGNVVTGLSEDVNLNNYNILKLPSSANEIGKDAFKDKIVGHELKFEIPSNITKYDEGAFENCSGLICNNLTFPESLVDIGTGAFRGCTGLTGMLAFSRPSSGEDLVLNGNEIFKDCTGISILSVQDNTKFQGYGTFQGCSSLATLDFHAYKHDISEVNDMWPKPTCKDPEEHWQLDGIAPSGILYYNTESSFLQVENDFKNFLSTRAKMDSDDVAEAKADPANRTKWQLMTWANENSVPDEGGFILKNLEACYGVSKKYRSQINIFTCVRTPNTVTSIESEAFKDLLKSKNDMDRWTLDLNLGVYAIKDSAFENCNGIVNSLIIPSSVAEIGNKAFYGCSNINGVLSFPITLKTVGEQAFSGTHVDKIVFNKNITNIGAAAFTNSKYVKVVDLTCFDTIPSELTIGEDAFKFSNDDSDPSSSGIVYVKKNLSAEWRSKLKGLPSEWQIQGVE